MKPQRLPFAMTQCWPAAGLETWMTRGLLRAIVLYYETKFKLVTFSQPYLRTNVQNNVLLVPSTAVVRGLNRPDLRPRGTYQVR